MCIINSIKKVVSNGASVLSAAAHGEFQESSPNIEMLRLELQESALGPAADKKRMFQDRVNISRDVAEALRNYQSSLQK